MITIIKVIKNSSNTRINTFKIIIHLTKFFPMLKLIKINLNKTSPFLIINNKQSIISLTKINIIILKHNKILSNKTIINK